MTEADSAPDETAAAVGATPAPGGTPAQVGPSPAPGTGHPATKTHLGRLGIALIVVVGLLYLALTVLSIATAPDVHVRPHHDHHGSGSPGRLTDTPSPLT